MRKYFKEDSDGKVVKFKGATTEDAPKEDGQQLHSKHYNRRDQTPLARLMATMLT